MKVYSAQHPTEAHLVKGILESHGIRCEVRGESLFNVRGEIPLTIETAPSVWIFDRYDFDKARAITQEYERSLSKESNNTENWKCVFCGEESEDQFTDCWKCGNSR